MPDTRNRLVVIGNGMVGHRFCEQMVERGAADAFHLTVVGEEPRPAYDRVNLTSYLNGKSAADLYLASREWYRENNIHLRGDERVEVVDRNAKMLHTSKGSRISYDYLVFATGSRPFVPKVPGITKAGVFLYRTLADLDEIRAYSESSSSAVVIGGGLLGLEAAKAVYDLGLKTHVVEFASRLMPRQLNEKGSGILLKKIEALGIRVLLDRLTDEIIGNGSVSGMRFAEAEVLDTDMIIVSAGIRPRDELAKSCGLELGEHGGISVDDYLLTSDPSIFAIGEVAAHEGTTYGLVAPGYSMADTLAANLSGETRRFTAQDRSTKLKLLGIDVASFGDPFPSGKGTQSVEYCDEPAGIYKYIALCENKQRVLGGMLVGDARGYEQLLHLSRTGQPINGSPEELLFGSRGESGGILELSDEAQVCSCNNVTKADLCQVISENEVTDMNGLKACTKAGTGCGGCVPLVADILREELEKAGVAVSNHLCPHFEYSRQELFQIVKVKKIRTFGEVLASHGAGSGCEVCKPAVASILASLWNDFVGDHETIQDTNDRFFANIQRGGTYSVVPRVPGGEITPEKLIVLGHVAQKYDLYTKITGGQRIDLFGATVEQLPLIWAELVAAGFESGHAYGKAVRTVKSCVGRTWCRYGVQDSTRFALRIEERYKGIRAPHKIKMAVSGCVRECAEAQSKDIGLIATENGWNLYVCGNGGAKPRHADLLATDLDEETAIRYIDRVLMYYIHTADKLTRTSVWMEKFDTGVEHLRDVVIHDSLGICDQLEADMSGLVGSYRCEWAEVVRDPAKQERFRHFANSDDADPTVKFEQERGQKRPADQKATHGDRVESGTVEAEWVRAGSVPDFPADSGVAFRHGDTQIAIFNFVSRNTWYAIENRCPHMHEMVLSRGIIGDEAGIPKVACPMHKKNFSLVDGRCLSGENLCVETYPVRVEAETVFVRLPILENSDANVLTNATYRESASV